MQPISVTPNLHTKDMLRVCRKCGVEKSLEDFAKHSACEHGRLWTCKECKNAYHRAYMAKNAEQRDKKRASRREWRWDRTDENEKARQWRLNNPEKQKLIDRRSLLKRQYGLSLEDYDRMVEAQNGKCAICKRTQPEGKPMHVDHIHETNQVRALLCGNCNTALGLFGDNVESIRAAADYVEFHKAVREEHMNVPTNHDSIGTN